MGLPFSSDQFLDVFVRYNQAIWPIPVLAYLLGVTAVALALRPVGPAGRVVAGILGCFWLWMGLVYHIGYFRSINPAAVGFGIAFIVQGALFLVVGGAAGQLAFRVSRHPRSLAGGLLVLYALVGYPLLGMWLGHAYPRAPVFGVAPCPTTIFTFGLLLWSSTRVPRYLLVIPVLWSLIGFSAALSLGMREDIGLVIAGLLASGLLLWRDRPPVAAGPWRQRAADQPNGSRPLYGGRA